MRHQSREYRRASQAVRLTCREVLEELELGNDPDHVDHSLARTGFQLVPGGPGTCYGVVCGFASHAPITLVVGRAVRGPVEGTPLVPGELGVELRQVRIEGPRVLEVLARAWRDYEDYRQACTCSHELLVDPYQPRESEQAWGYVCPACRIRPFRPKGKRGEW